MDSLLIRDTTREERIRIVRQSLNVCGHACEFCNGCDNLGGGDMDAFYQPYELNMEYAASHSGAVHG